MLPEPRYVVTELSGLLGDHHRVPGISCHVIDRHENYRLVSTFRSEDETRWQGSEGMRTETRRKARECAARLNG